MQNLPSILEVLNYFWSTCVFHKKKAYNKIKAEGSGKELFFLLTKCMFSLSPLAFAFVESLPTRYKLMGTLPTLSPLISANESKAILLGRTLHSLVINQVCQIGIL